MHFAPLHMQSCTTTVAFLFCFAVLAEQTNGTSALMHCWQAGSAIASHGMAERLTVQDHKLHCCKGVTCNELRDCGCVAFFVPVVWPTSQSCGLSLV